MRRCVPYAGGIACGTGRPLTDGDRAAVAEFEQFLRDAYQKDHDMTEPDQTHPDQAPKSVDLKAAGVDGWFFVLEQIQAKKAELAEAEKTAREHIENALGDQVDGLIDGKPVVRWLHTAAPKQFNKKALAKDHPDIVAKYTTFGEPGRRFELVKPKGGKS